MTARAFGLIALVGTAACGDPCHGGDTECVDDHTLRSCSATRDGWSVSYDWRADTCPTFNAYCVTRSLDASAVPQARGLCASAADRSPACAPHSAGYCADGIRYSCFDGYPVSEERCTNGCSPVSDGCRR